MPDFNKSTSDPMLRPALGDVDRAAYGEIDAGDNEQEIVFGRRVPLEQIYPDLKQPRRAIPAEVRGDWDGDPHDLLAVLGNWHALVEDKLGAPVDLPALLRQTADNVKDQQVESDEPLVANYLALVKLAQSIYAEGLRLPIEIYRTGIGYKLQFGERRWLAHNLLMMHTSNDFASIPAVITAAPNVWAQAAENGTHRPLNAIGMARQLALLVMNMYEGDKGVSFTPYEELVLPGECDRKYYAQVARGDLYRIKDGYLARVLSVTGLPSKDQVSRYRAMLNIDDALWAKADSQNWTEGAIREYVQTANKLKEIEAGEAAKNAESSGNNDTNWLTTVNLLPQQPTVSPFSVGDHIILTKPGEALKFGIVYQLTAVDDKLHGFNRAGDSEAFEPEHVVKIGEDTGLSAIQFAHLLHFRSIRPAQAAEKPPSITPPLTTGLTTSEIATLERAHRVLLAANSVDAGWFPQSTYQMIAIKGLTDLGYLEKTVRKYGGADSQCVRITRDGCRVIARQYVDHDGSSRALYSDLNPPPIRRFPYDSFVVHLETGHVAQVKGGGTQSVAQPDGGTIETPYLEVREMQLSPLVRSIWKESEVREATAAEIAAAGGDFTPRPPARDDGDDDEDTEGTQTPHEPTGAHRPADSALAHPAVADATAPLLKSWANPELAGVLSLLLRLSANEPQTKLRVQELLTLSNTDLRGLVEKSAALPGYWGRYLAEVEGLITQLVGAQIIGAVHSFTDHLRDIGAGIEQE